MLVTPCKLSDKKLHRLWCSGPSHDPQACDKIIQAFQFISSMKEMLYAGRKYNQFNDGNKQLKNYLDCNLASSHFSELFLIFWHHPLQAYKNIKQRSKLQSLHYQKNQSHL